MLVIVYCMIRIGDAIMLCTAKLYDMLICCCMMICIVASCAGLIRLIGRDEMFWPRGAGLRTPRRNAFCRGHLASNDVRRVPMVVRVLA